MLPSTIPRVGLGTFELRGPACTAAVLAALGAGYRHIDTAAVYQNEAAVAAGIAASGVPRAALFLTSKLSPREHGARAYAAVLASLARLHTPYLDLALIHFPGAAGLRADDPRVAALRLASWRALERLRAEGHCRYIGVSNYTARHLDELLAQRVWPPPFCNQIELHPLLQQRETVAACARHGIALVAYASLARGSAALLDADAVRRAAEAHAATPAQVALAWALAKGYAVLPKSADAARIASNFAATELCLTDGEMAALDALEEAHGSLRTCWDSAGVL